MATYEVKLSTGLRQLPNSTALITSTERGNGLEGNGIINLEIIEGNYNAHVSAFDRAFDNNDDYRMEFENGYLSAIEYCLGQLGVEYEIDVAGYMTIEGG